MLPYSSVVKKKNLSLSFTPVSFEGAAMGMTGQRSSSAGNATQCCRKSGGGYQRGAFLSELLLSPCTSIALWRSCNYRWNLLWMRGRDEASVNRLLKIPPHFSRDEGTITSVSWPDSSSLLSAHVKFPLPLPPPFVLEKLSFASSPNDSRVMLLAHN